MPAAIKGWSDAEKVAVLLSIIRTSAVTPKWKELPLPVGRTLGATQKMYEKIRESGDAIEMNSPEKVPAARKMGPRGGRANGTPSRTPKKGARVKNEDEEDSGSDGTWKVGKFNGEATTAGKRKRGGNGGGRGGKKGKLVTDEEIAGSEDENVDGEDWGIVKKEPSTSVEAEEGNEEVAA
ncbi:uncharacterized protein KY384_007249 [Bacidia gigantensis]|uniref:uncharacterized protein n=1 Tax=Bacidia gigantensis TaxID=2732470 RepID=UPI001D05186C|nr:uncharacterized protein KY384_007249 [Bacidia gigantensis]KAG8528331.1 hypothetical protein KY384_007249 [Bacidia gigantensis]